jgi:glycosyltransferase involved in cell wall biosynthesis
MSVFNDAAYLEESVRSVLSQEGVELELVAVNDGSTDESSALLRRYAERDPRIRLIDQENLGLTRALIRGCSAARGVYIARQDSDDASLPGRLRRQIDRIETSPRVRLVSCWTSMIGPKGEELFVEERRDTAEQATRNLRQGQARQVKGLGGHGSALFRRSDYETVGGYRAEFYLAQDLDLWLRLTDEGLLDFVPEVLYRARFSPSCLSTSFQAQQIELARIALRLAAARKAGEQESHLLEEAARVRPAEGMSRGSTRHEALGSYFIGKCLLDRRDSRAVAYLGRAVRYRPWDVKAWAALGISLLRSSFAGRLLGS